MKLCVLSTCYPRYEGDYAGNFIHDLGLELKKNNIEIFVVAPSDQKIKPNQLIDGIKVFRFKYWFTKKQQKVAYNNGIPDNLSASFFAKIQLIFFLFSFFYKSLKVAKKCDIIHAHFLLSGLIGIFVKKITGRKLIVTAHGSDVRLIKKNKFFFKFIVKLISNSDNIIAVSNSNKDILMDMGIDKRKITVIPNGINFFNSMQVKKRNKHLKIIKILWVGRMVKIKGLEYLIKSMPTILEKNSNVKLILIGDGPLREKIKKLSKKLNIEKHIELLGFLKHEEVMNFMIDSDIFVLPSLGEGLPIVVLEAMASSTPVIATNVGGISDAVYDGVNGYLVDACNSNQIAERLQYLINNHDERIKLGYKGYELIKKKFVWNIIAKNTVKLYNN